MPQTGRRLASKRKFYARLIKSFILSFIIVFCALFIGVLGYHFIAGLGWIDAFLNAAMILGGMGPVNALETNAAKLFAAFYALFSGIVFVSVSAVLIAPLIHRFLHKFHLEDTE